MNISVVIPYAGRAQRLLRCVGSLTEQTLPRSAYEVVVVTDGATLSRADCARMHSCGVNIIPKDHTGVCGTRNAGIRTTHAPLIVFVDDDCIATSSLLAAYVQYFHRHKHVAAAGGTVIGDEDTSILASYARYRRLLGAPILCGGAIQTVITANCCIRRDALLAVNAFDERFDEYFRSCGGEDTDLSYVMRNAGLRLGYCHDAVAYHAHRRTLTSFIKQQVRNGEGVYVHSQFRSRCLSEFGLPEPRLLALGAHLCRYCFVSTPESPSLGSRVHTYWADSSLTVLQKALFPCVDLLRRLCYLSGLVRGSLRRRRIVRIMTRGEPGFGKRGESV